MRRLAGVGLGIPPDQKQNQSTIGMQHPSSPHKKPPSSFVVCGALFLDRSALRAHLPRRRFSRRNVCNMPCTPPPFCCSSSLTPGAPGYPYSRRRSLSCQPSSGVFRPAFPSFHKKAAVLKTAAFSRGLIYFLLRASSMALAAVLPAPMARMTVAAPVTASPPA